MVQYDTPFQVLYEVWRTGTRGLIKLHVSISLEYIASKEFFLMTFKMYYFSGVSSQVKTFHNVLFFQMHLGYSQNWFGYNSPYFWTSKDLLYVCPCISAKMSHSPNTGWSDKGKVIFTIPEKGKNILWALCHSSALVKDYWTQLSISRSKSK